MSVYTGCILKLSIPMCGQYEAEVVSEAQGEPLNFTYA